MDPSHILDSGVSWRWINSSCVSYKTIPKVYRTWIRVNPLLSNGQSGHNCDAIRNPPDINALFWWFSLGFIFVWFLNTAAGYLRGSIIIFSLVWYTVEDINRIPECKCLSRLFVRKTNTFSQFHVLLDVFFFFYYSHFLKSNIWFSCPRFH